MYVCVCATKKHARGWVQKRGRMCQDNHLINCSWMLFVCPHFFNKKETLWGQRVKNAAAAAGATLMPQTEWRMMPFFDCSTTVSNLSGFFLLLQPKSKTPITLQEVFSPARFGKRSFCCVCLQNVSGNVIRLLFGAWYLGQQFTNSVNLQTLWYSNF